LFREISANTKISNLFRIKFEFGKKTVSSFAKPENPEKKILSHCLNLDITN